MYCGWGLYKDRRTGRGLEMEVYLVDGTMEHYPVFAQVPGVELAEMQKPCP